MRHPPVAALRELDPGGVQIEPPLRPSPVEGDHHAFSIRPGIGTPPNLVCDPVHDRILHLQAGEHRVVHAGGIDPRSDGEVFIRGNEILPGDLHRLVIQRIAIAARKLPQQIQHTECGAEMQVQLHAVGHRPLDGQARAMHGQQRVPHPFDFLFQVINQPPRAGDEDGGGGREIHKARW